MKRSISSVFFALALIVPFLFSTTGARAAYKDWSFDPGAFESRLLQDYFMQDGIDSNFFLNEDPGPVKGLLDRMITRLEEDDEDYPEDAPVYDRVATGTEPCEGRRIDASAQGVASLRDRLDTLARENATGSDERFLALYRDVCRVRRARRLVDVAELIPEFLYTKHYVIGGSHYAYTEDVTDEWFNDYSVNRQYGGQLIRATFDPDGVIRNEVLVGTAEGTLRDPDVSWDGQRVLFSMRKHLETDDFHIYEYDTETKELRQITSGPGVADIEPIYLPNDDILFGSTRCMQITDCWWTEVSNFYTCDLAGHFLRRVSVDQVTVNYPKTLPDGRVIYTRWDYNDRGQIFPQGLFQMNYDGTAQTEFYGNNSFFPTTIMHARGIPGSDRVIAVASGHHSYQHGKLILLDRSKGTQENEGCTLVAPIRETPADRIDAYGQEGELFQYPYPLNETTLLCAYLPEGGAWSYETPFGLYWFDLDGERELLAFDPSISCGQPIALQERETPTTRPSQVDLNQTTGRFYVQDVYEGPGLQGIERGVVKALRVVALEFRAAGIGQTANGGAAGGALVCTPPSYNNATWDVKHVLGEVPIEEDGSAYFEVPAMTPVYFQLLDGNGDVVQTMRSWSTLQRGETFACVGCHEPKNTTLGNTAVKEGTTTIALRKGVSQLNPVVFPSKGAYEKAGFSFPRDIQPIFDHHCVSCHTGRDGAPFSLLGDEHPVPKEIEHSELVKRLYSESYMNLTNYGVREGSKYINWLDIQAGPPMLKPYTAGAFKSKLITMFRSPDGQYGGQDEDHKDVHIDEASVKLMAMWIDLLLPYCGDYVESNDWTPEERAQYEYYWTKRKIEDGINEFNTELKRIAINKNDPSLGKYTANIDFGGLETRQAFISGYLARRLPSIARREGKLNTYRNLALNPNDVQGDSMQVAMYPHASSNSEYGYADEFAAKNAIDGKKDNKGHGPDFPSWGPNLRTDLWLNVDFGCEVDIDKCVIYARADFPHDDVWQSGTLEFSDGSTVDIELRPTAEPQEFKFDKRRVTSVRLTNLKPNFPLKWCGITEIEYWGVTAP
ncbi:MAG: DUF7402 domain-containing protein [Thermoguttaceae bacterium]|jgi:hypothetical protein